MRIEGLFLIQVDVIERNSNMCFVLAVSSSMFHGYFVILFPSLNNLVCKDLENLILFFMIIYVCVSDFPSRIEPGPFQ